MTLCDNGKRENNQSCTSYFMPIYIKYEVREIMLILTNFLPFLFVKEC